MRPDPADIRFKLFRDMLLVRRVEERIAALYPEGDIRCPVHLSIGQEAVAAGVCAALGHLDYAISAHRSHAHYINKGGSLKKMFAELYGKATGCSGGVGGSMHLIDLQHNFLGCVPIVGATIPIGVGAALGLKLHGNKAVVAVFFGDGAVETGAFHEALNYAALHKLRVLFVCEDNGLSVNTPVRDRQPSRNIGEIAAGYRIAAGEYYGQDVATVHRTASRAVEEIRATGHPTLFVYQTHRFAEHCGPAYTIDPATDPVKLYRDHLESDGTMQPADYLDMCHQIDAEIEAAVIFAKTSPWPVAT